MVYKRGRLAKHISNDQGPFVSAIKRSRQLNFRESKILIPVANGSTCLMKVTNPPPYKGLHIKQASKKADFTVDLVWWASPQLTHYTHLRRLYHLSFRQYL